MSKKLILVIVTLILLTSCADQLNFVEAAVREPVGFFHGIWHGMISIIAFICSWFSDSVAIYAIYNTGGWYDFGFLMGVGGFASTTKTIVVQSLK